MDKFPVNSGNIPPPPSHSTLVPLKHGPPPNLQINRTQNLPGTNGNRRKRKEANETPLLKLERIIGLTSNTSNMIATDPTSDQIAYAAGAVVVLYNFRKNKQIAFLYPPPSVTNTVGVQPSNSLVPSIPAWSMNAHPSAAEWASPNVIGNDMKYPMQDMDDNAGKKRTSAGSRPKTISCLAFSADGNYLAVGEVGHQPRIFVWNVKQQSLVCVLKGHKFGIVSVAFSSDMRHLASVGFQHDGYLNVWNWRKGTKVASNRVTSRVNAMAFAQDGTHFITAGLRHIKFWNLSSTGKSPLQSNFQSVETQVLDGRAGLLGTLRNNNFVDVVCDPENSEIAYLLSETGLLCMFKEGRILDKWVDLQVKVAFSIDICKRYIICACDNGTVRLFEPRTLRYCGMLPRPHPLGVDLTSFVNVQQLESIKDTAVYPDTLAIQFDSTSNKVSCIYSDRSLIVWDVKHPQRIAMYRSFISHSECVWGTERYPQQTASSATRPYNNSRHSFGDANLPPFTFATHSADGTVRFWNIDSGLPTSDLAMSPRSMSPTSPLSSYPSLVSPPLSLIASASMKSSFPPSDSDTQTTLRRNIFSKELIKMLYLDPEAAEFAKISKDIDAPDLQDHGIRALKLSSDGSLMATGDRKGNLRVHRISDWEEITYLEAHDSEILTIDFNTPTSNDHPFLIASASRDRLIHVFDIENDFKLLQTMDDHSSSITAVKFSLSGAKLISCSADKSVIFRSSNLQSSQQPPFYTSYHNHSGRATVFDMELDLHDKYIVMVTGERRLSLLSLETGKLFRTCKPETVEEDASGMTIENSGGSLIDVDLDPISGTFAVTAGSDKCVRLFDLITGVCIHKVAAHSELVTSVRFLNGPNGILRVVSTSSDGSIFVWRVDSEASKKMVQRAKDRTDRLRQAKPEVNTEALQSKNSLPPAGQPIKPVVRVRRTSAVPPLKIGTESVRTERKSFSHMSKAETKYDDIYKKLERGSPKSQNEAPQSPVLAGRLRGRVSSPSPRDPNTKGVVSSVSTPRLSAIEGAPQNNQWRGSPPSRKKDPAGTSLNPNADNKADASASALSNQRHSKHSPRLRHRVSHDVLVQDRKSSLASTGESAGTSSQRQSYSNVYRAIAHRRSNSSARLSNSETEEPASNVGSSSMPDLHAIAEGQTGKFSSEMVNEPDSVVDSDPDKDSSYDEASQNDNSASIDGDDEPEAMDDESMVYLTPFVDLADPKPFQVEDAEQNNFEDGENNDKDDEDEQTVHSDTDSSINPSQTFTAEDSDSSSEDNTDEALVKSIAMRNPPPMSTLRKSSVKRSGRMSLRSIVQSFNAMKPGSEPVNQSNNNRGESFSSLKRKMEQAKKRLSFSTRYLSNLNTQNLITEGLKIEDGLKPKDISMPIAPLEIPSNARTNVMSREAGTAHIPIVLTVAEIAEINDKKNGIEEPVTVDPKPAKEQAHGTIDVKAENHNCSQILDPEQILSELSVIDNCLDSFVKLCDTADNKRFISSQHDLRQKLKTKMLLIQGKANHFLEEFSDTLPKEYDVASHDKATAALLNEYSDKLIQMVESKLNLKNSSR